MQAAAWIVGIYVVVLILLIVLLAWNNFKPDADGMPAPSWEQITLLLASLGTLATGAAGVLLGTGVQQFNVHTAQREAIRADREAEKVSNDKAETERRLKEVKAETARGLLEMDLAANGAGAEEGVMAQASRDNLVRARQHFQSALLK